MNTSYSWKFLLEEAMSGYSESLDDIESNTMSEEEMNEIFDVGYGCNEGCPFTVWTKKSVYFPVCYDGSEWVGRISRHPDGIATHHQGG